MASVVLIIEDDSDIRGLLGLTMKPTFAVCEASTLAEGIRIANDVKPCAVILDLILPNCRGLTSLKRFVAEVPDAVVIVLTADPSVQGPEAIAAGAFSFITKPCYPKDIFERVRDAIGVAERIEKLKSHYDSTRELAGNIKKTLEEMRPTHDMGSTPTAS